MTPTAGGTTCPECRGAIGPFSIHNCPKDSAPFLPEWQIDAFIVDVSDCFLNCETAHMLVRGDDKRGLVTLTLPRGGEIGPVSTQFVVDTSRMANMVEKIRRAQVAHSPS